MKEQEQSTLFDDFSQPSMDVWWELIRAETKKEQPETALAWKPQDGFLVSPFYPTPDSASGYHHPDPGIAPYTRGTESAEQASLPWRIRHRVHSEKDVLPAELTKLQESKRAEVELVIAARPGDTGFTFDTPVQLQTIVERVAEFGLPMVINAGLYSNTYFASVRAAKARNVAAAITSLQFDPIEHLLLHGSIPGGTEAAFSFAADVVRYEQDHSCVTRTLSIGSHAFHNAGASPSFELACSLASGVEYLQQLLGRGVSLDVASGSSFPFPRGQILLSRSPNSGPLERCGRRSSIIFPLRKRRQ
jgi:methylmalonyl-CoA mutase